MEVHNSRGDLLPVYAALVKLEVERLILMRGGEDIPGRDISKDLSLFSKRRR
jgi:hypothetical protein